MKKLVYLLIAVSLMLALVPTVALAHTEDDPLVVDLLAGQTTDIGDVKVWNDADTLYVQFVYEGPDCGFLKVHLQVDEGASFSEDILTKKGNPIPGQFEKSYKPGWCFNEHTFAFDLSGEGFKVGDDLVIAAHAGLGLAETMDYYASGETAWGAGTRFTEDKNWATYFNYTVQPPPVICADFSGLNEGASVEGLGTVAPDLEIDTPTGGAVKIVEGGTTNVYGAPNLACGYTPIVNGGIVADGGFSDKTAQGAQGAHAYTFTFAPDVAVNDFSLHMLDFGDWNPSHNTHHYASMTAYDAGDNVVATHELEYNSDGKGNPRWSDYGDLLCDTGDASDADPGEPGNWTWSVYGSGIVRVELFFGYGYDPNIGFDTLCFVLQ